MNSDEILFDAEERMEKAVGVFRDELRGLRTGRATPALVDSIRVEYYGSPTPLKQLAQISTPDPQQIVIRPFDQNCLKDVEKAIRSSDVGMSPTNDGKIALRNIRRDANKHFDQAEKAKDMTEDERDAGKEDVQNLLKKYEDKVTEMADKKGKEVMEQ